MLNNLKPCKGARKKRKRIGRGTGSGHGGTSCRGHKGQNSRSGGGKGPGFEGGQMPLQRRLPKRGFRNRFKTIYTVINLRELEPFEPNEVITPETLKSKGITKSNAKLIKILSEGTLEKALHIKAHKFSQQAVKKIESAGGKVEVLRV